MASPSSSLVEFYMFRKIHEEKMEKIEATNDQTEVMSNPRDQTESTPSDRHQGGCFFGLFKKIHPTTSDASPQDSGR
ncbi:hypothetical protein RHSIM_Rhsim07G0199800 [Rhododendron simsii]|uniref:Uncharacterized protein n=1 Tax=Rhododendron simsii TaxID=118357 RepID=A0A834LJN2_RHOSS|nr:hypothetical protein RHSIM_Rhsim07G0199800 [Rhododendron simsii]